MKNALLITIAASALFAGSGMASAQDMEQRPQTQQKAPDLSGSQKGAGKEVKADQKPAAAETSGQAAKPAEAQKQDSGKSQAGQSGSGSGAAASSNQQNQDKGQASSGTSAQGSGQAGTSAQGQSSGAAAQGQSGTSTTPSGSGSGGSASVTLSTEQKAKIRETVISQSNAPRVSNVNFSLSVGTIVPRTVRIAPVPTTIVEIHPAWRGYMYFIVGDQIVIVEPNTLRIIAVIAV